MSLCHYYLKVYIYYNFSYEIMVLLNIGILKVNLWFYSDILISLY